MIGVDAEADRRTGVPVHSLYGDSPASLRPRRPTSSTASTSWSSTSRTSAAATTRSPGHMLYAMEAAADGSASPFVVLDRPNPIGGLAIEGPTIRPGLRQLRRGPPGADPPRPDRRRAGPPLRGPSGSSTSTWRSSPATAGAGRCSGPTPACPGSLPSPNMPTPDTALVYPGGCLIEGTNLSEGRGTTRPFELWGAPWLDPIRPGRRARPERRWGRDLPPAAPSGRPSTSTPGQPCGGVQPHVTDPAPSGPWRLYTALLAAAARARTPTASPGGPSPTSSSADPIAIDLLFGSDRERRAIEDGHPRSPRSPRRLAADGGRLPRAPAPRSCSIPTPESLDGGTTEWTACRSSASMARSNAPWT